MSYAYCLGNWWKWIELGFEKVATYPPPPCISYARVQATVGVGTVIIVYVILIAYGM